MEPQTLNNPAAGFYVRLSDLMTLTKARLTTLVMLSVMVGFYFGSPDHLDVGLLVDALIGITLVAAGSSALNQLLERHIDARMDRTKNRPLPSGRMNPGSVLYFGAISSIAGMFYLAIRVNTDAALWATITLATYIFIYTPLKQKTSLNTLVGAVPGAIPPLIGYVAARGHLTPQAWALFAIVFVWQLPHFLAIAWLYRQDYAQAGLVMLPKVDTEGVSCGRQVVVNSLMLIPVTLAPWVLHMTGPIYALGAVLFGIGFLVYGVKFALKRTDTTARQLFLASVIYLPLLLALMMVDSNG